MATLILDKLICHQTQDLTGADDAYIKVNGDVVSGPHRMNNGDSISVGYQSQFNDRVTIELWEHDSPDPDDLLGRHVVSPGTSGTLPCKNDGANYDLGYRF
jgi:hypothetical protein